MKRRDNNALKAAAAPRGAAPGHRQQQQPASMNIIPRGFREAMTHISMKMAENTNKTPGMASKTAAPPKTAAPAVKWKSSFKPIDEPEDQESQEKNTSSPQRDVYSPYDPVSSDSEQEMPKDQAHSRSPPVQDNKLEHQRLSPVRGTQNKDWDIPYSDPESPPLNERDSSPEARCTETRGFSPAHRLPEQRSYSPDADLFVPPGYGSVSKPLDHRVSSPDRFIHGSSIQRFPASYGAQRTNGEERITIPGYTREVSPTRLKMTTTGRLSPPRLQRDYQHQLGYMEAASDQITPSPELTGKRGRNVIMEKDAIVCDLCDVEVANSQELQFHLESKTHWDTLEHIQQENNYDDLAIAFLQEVMLYKSRQCSRAIEDSVLQALEENDHMTKIEIFHCAACNIFLSTSASSVHTHITSQGHLSNTKEFEVQQRRTCLSRAETMMKELKPQFEHFLKGGCPFE